MAGRIAATAGPKHAREPGIRKDPVSVGSGRSGNAIREGAVKQKTCEACGAAFTCSASGAGCWCADVELSGGALAELRERFRDCLCQRCLPREGQVKASRLADTP